MEKFNLVVKGIIGFCLITFILFIGSRHFVFHTIHFDNARVFELKMQNGEIDKLYLLPKRTLIMRNQHDSLYEYCVFNVTGKSVPHYFGSIYNTGETYFSIKSFSNAKDVWNVEMGIIKKEGNNKTTTFDQIGTKYKSRIILYSQAIKIDELLYKAAEFTEEDNQFISSLR